MHFNIHSSKENRILYIHSSKIIKQKKSKFHAFIYTFFKNNKTKENQSFMHSSKITKQKKIKFHAFIYAFLKKNKTKKIKFYTFLNAFF